jgi:hypothetical protein
MIVTTSTKANWIARHQLAAFFVLSFYWRGGCGRSPR